MTFYITKTNGTSLATIADGTVDRTSTSISLIGKNFPTYGQYLNQDLVSLLENSANTTAPAPAMLGQVWHDTSANNLKFYREAAAGNYWQKLAMTTESTTAPASPSLGDLWWDTTNSQLKLYDPTNDIWRVIGPQTTSNGELRVTSGSSFTIQVGGNNALTIDQFGAIGQNFNPLVIGTNSTSVADLTSGSENSYNTWNPVISIDKASNFNSASGEFTAKSSGIYQVMASVTTLGGGVTNLQWQIDYGATDVRSTNNHPNTETHQLSCNGMLEITAGSVINFTYATGTGVSISRINSTFSITKVG